MSPADTPTVPIPQPLPLPATFGKLKTVIRPLHAGDEERLRAFFASHTPDTIYARYACHLSVMTPERASALVNVDPARDCALGIFGRDAAGGEVLYAVARYMGDHDGKGAETAFVVHEKTRRLGMARRLLQLLMVQARRHGIPRLWAQVLMGNEDMIGVLEKEGFRLRKDVFSGTVNATLDLTAPA